jgi:nitroimidazol reductase NimA-like FMN-containing flavoprotein (pyridoxamine 5'-phosphate oxidase superfamily)
MNDRVAFRRLPERGTHDRDVIDAILDAAMVCHVGIADAQGPVVIPTLFARDGDSIILHGSPASRLLRSATTQEVCVTVTLVDGLVLARSAFHHSMNYRSVVVFGTPSEITDDVEKTAALDRLVEHLVPGRNPTLRPMHRNELKGTKVLRLSLDTASAKVRTGGPVDDEEDYELPIWAGVIPMHMASEAPITDPLSPGDVPVPDHVLAFTEG